MRPALQLGRFLASWALIIGICFTRVIPPLKAAEQKPGQPLKVGFILVGPANDSGWSYAHNQGRLYLQAFMKNKVQTSVVENIPESGEAERVMEKMISQGVQLLFATSYGYLEPGARVAARHPDVIIMQCQRSTPLGLKNFGTYWASQHDPIYIAGVVAGRMTHTNKLGYVCGHPVPPVLACINAFELGARSVNPKCTVHAIWTNNWSDPPTESEAAKSLIDTGVDIVASQLSSSITVSQVADRLGAYSIGYSADLNSLVPKSWLTGQCWNWGPVYVKIAQSVIDHTWKPGDRYYTMKDGCVKLATLGKSIPPAVQKEALAVDKQITDGTFIVFKGPMKDRDGKMRLAPGQIADRNTIATMDWVVSGVDCALPK